MIIMSLNVLEIIIIVLIQLHVQQTQFRTINAK